MDTNSFPIDVIATGHFSLDNKTVRGEFWEIPNDFKDTLKDDRVSNLIEPYALYGILRSFNIETLAVMNNSFTRSDDDYLVLSIKFRGMPYVTTEEFFRISNSGFETFSHEYSVFFPDECSENPVCMKPKFCWSLEGF
jgi:hypothetical protein